MTELQTKHVQTVELILRGPDGQIKRQDMITMEAPDDNANSNTD
jgi:hypothetical protein